MMSVLWGVLAAQITGWPSAGIALLVCIVIGLAIAALVVNRRDVAQDLEAPEPDPLAIPRRTGVAPSAEVAAPSPDPTVPAAEAEPIDV